MDEIGLDRLSYGTHSMRSTKATLTYRKMKNLPTVQLLLGHTNLDYGWSRPCADFRIPPKNQLKATPVTLPLETGSLGGWLNIG